MLPTSDQLQDLVILLLAALLQVAYHWTHDYLQLQRVRLSQPPTSGAEPSPTVNNTRPQQPPNHHQVAHSPPPPKPAPRKD